MRTFKIIVAGKEVTDQNYISVASEIKKEHGICPALNKIVTSIAVSIMPERSYQKKRLQQSSE